MSIHASRPLPPRAPSEPTLVHPPLAAAAPPSPAESPAADAVAPDKAVPDPTTTSVASGPVSRRADDRAAAAAAPGRPWYREEPWLALTALAAALVMAAIWAPAGAKYPLIGVAGVCMVVGLALLVRRGSPPHVDT
jgi:hypothetical protein